MHCASETIADIAKTLNETAAYMAHQNIGFGGEFLAYMEIAQLHAPWRILCNLLIPAARGWHDTEIDIVMIHTTGVYVLEVKQRSGSIYGTPREPYWTQRLGGKSYVFMNPLRQNYGHVQALKKKLRQFGDVNVHPIVVFGDYCEFRKPLALPEEHVIHTRQLMETVAGIARKTGACMSAQEAKRLYEHLAPWAKPSRRRRERHLQYVRRRQRHAIQKKKE